MATTSTSTSNFSGLVSQAVLQQVEAELRAMLPYASAGNTEYVPATYVKGTNTWRIARYADLAVVTTALTEGTAPTTGSLTIDSESFNATAIGNVVGVTDLAQIESPHDLFGIAVERLARNAAVSIDTLVREQLVAGGTVYYGGGKTARSTIVAGDVITGALVKKMRRELEKLAIPPFSDGMYRAVITPSQRYDLVTDTATGGWMDVFKYVDNTPLLTGEVGQYGGIRFIQTTGAQAKIFSQGGSASADVHAGVFFGPEAFAMGDVQTLSAYFVPPGGDHSDPIAQQGLFGWKVNFGALLFTKNPRLIRLETGVTA